MSGSYHHVRYRWWDRANLGKMAEKFKNRFTVNMVNYPKDWRDMSLRKDDRDELIVIADTLMAHLSSFRAVLSQKKMAKFTANDVELRRQVSVLYSHTQPTPFLEIFDTEPKYKIEK